MNNTGLFYALCQTFLHSMWQGLIAALLAGMILLFTRRSSPVVRYYLLLGVFVAFMIAAAITFYIVLPGSTVTYLYTAAGGANVLIAAVEEPVEPGLAKGFLNYLSAHSQFIVSVWFVVFLIKLVNMLIGVVFIQYMRRHRVTVNSTWQEKVDQLASALQLRRPIRLLESAIAKVPMTAGFFKPVIFIPAGMILGLPAAEVEAVLLHELGHIRRGDYIVNLIQCMAETIFFFNPALLWISSLIRSEREHCCDEIAVNGTKDKTSYIRALVAFQEYNAGTHAALQFAGRKGHLVERVKRMITRENKKLNAGEKAILVISSAALIIFLGSLQTPASPQKKKVHMAEARAASGVSAAQASSVPHRSRSGAGAGSSSGKIKTSLPGKATITLQTMVASSVPDAGFYYVPQDTIPVFKSISSNIHDDDSTRTEDITAKDDKGNIYRYKKLNDRIIELSLNSKPVPEEDHNKYNEIVAALDRNREMSIQKLQERRYHLEEMRVKQDSMRQRLLWKREQMRQRSDSMHQHYIAEAQRNIIATQLKRQLIQARQDSVFKLQQLNQLNIKLQQLRKDSIRLKSDLNLRKNDLNLQKIDFHYNKSYAAQTVRPALKAPKYPTAKQNYYKPYKVIPESY